MIATITLNPALDRSIYVSSLQPNDANRVARTEIDAGGKGINASRVLKELGSETVALGFLGGNTGRYIDHVLRNEGIDTDFVRLDVETRTNICIQESSGAPPTVLDEPGPTLTSLDLDELYTKVRKVAHKSSMVAFGGSLPPGAPKDIYKTLVEIVASEGAKAILDSDGEPMVLGLQASPFMIKPNKDEVRRLVGIEIKTTADALQAAKHLAENGVKLVVISLGSQGAVALYEGEAVHAIPPEVKAVSTIGSGDSMVAGITHVINRGGTLEDALRWGTAAGAATAMTDGTGICKRHEVAALLAGIGINRL